MIDRTKWPTDEDVEKALRAAADYLRKDGNEPPLTDAEWNADKAECPEEFAQSASAMRAALSAVNPYEWRPDDEQFKCGARAIGRTMHTRNHDDRIREVVRSMNERDDSWPSPLPPSPEGDR